MHNNDGFMYFHPTTYLIMSVSVDEGRSLKGLLGCILVVEIKLSFSLLTNLIRLPAAQSFSHPACTITSSAALELSFRCIQKRRLDGFHATTKTPSQSLLSLPAPTVRQISCQMSSIGRACHFLVLILWSPSTNTDSSRKHSPRKRYGSHCQHPDSTQIEHSIILAQPGTPRFIVG